MSVLHPPKGNAGYGRMFRICCEPARSFPLERIGSMRIAPSNEDVPMAALVELIVQKIADATPLENTVSNFVASVLENTANKLARFETPAEQDAPLEKTA
jgi:hypothetical protein